MTALAVTILGGLAMGVWLWILVVMFVVKLVMEHPVIMATVSVFVWAVVYLAIHLEDFYD